MVRQFKSNKSRWYRSGALALLTLSAGWGSSSAQALEYSLQDFRVEGTGIFNSTGNSFSGMVSWLPGLTVMQNLDVKGNFGYTLHKGTGNALANVGQLGALVSYRIIDPLAVELGGGVQLWQGQSAAGMGDVNAVWIPQEPIFGRINKVVAGYSYIASGVAMHEGHVGVEISLSTLISGKQEAAAAAPAAK